MALKPTYEELLQTNFKTLVIAAISLLILFGSCITLYAQSDNLRFKQVLNLGTLILDFTQDKDGFFGLPPAPA